MPPAKTTARQLKRKAGLLRMSNPTNARILNARGALSGDHGQHYQEIENTEFS